MEKKEIRKSGEKERRERYWRKGKERKEVKDRDGEKGNS